MTYAHQIAAAAFAALALLPTAQAQTAAPAGAAPARAFPNLYVDVPNNTYMTKLVSRFDGMDYVRFYELVNCTTGLITTSGSHPYAPGGSTVSVTQLTLKAQDMVRANCNSNGLQAGF